MVHRSEQIVERIFRTEYGKLVATLTRIFGARYIQLAEDVVQETLISALDHWVIKGIPDNPSGWLMQVAKRKGLNELKRLSMVAEHHKSYPFDYHKEHNIDNVFLDSEIEDSELRMIFTCCHPSLSIESQISLTLKTLCGFGVKEVASALLATESTINKRLYRSKTTIKNSNLPFDIPQGRELESRLKVVCLTLYLLFNEGYNSSSGDAVIQKELCLEAVRMTRLLADRFGENQELFALLALMCFHTARFDARIDNHGAIVVFEDQDRSLWNKDLINVGMFYLKKSTNSSILSAYHLEAGIASEHCMAGSFESTNWSSIYDQYQLLEKLKPNPIISLNLAIIQSQLVGVEESLRQLDLLTNNATLKNYHLLPATQGIFHMKAKNFKIAISYLKLAQKLKPSPKENSFLESKICECQKYLN